MNHEKQPDPQADKPSEDPADADLAAARQRLTLMAEILEQAVPADEAPRRPKRTFRRIDLY